MWKASNKRMHCMCYGHVVIMAIPLPILRKILHSLTRKEISIIYLACILCIRIIGRYSYKMTTPWDFGSKGRNAINFIQIMLVWYTSPTIDLSKFLSLPWTMCFKGPVHTHCYNSFVMKWQTSASHLYSPGNNSRVLELCVVIH